MKLNEDSLKWAIQHLVRYSDTDLFPRPYELEIIKANTEQVIKELTNVDLGNYKYGSSRRFIVPKDEFSYRTATQLDILDNLFLSAIIYEFGEKIETRRVATNENKIFSYRYKPQSDGSLYNSSISWNEFWKECQKKSNNYNYIVSLDISDFYNQIYHHTIENQLEESSLPNQVIKWIMTLLENVTVKVSRGIPVGPHSTHLLAEMSLIPVDQSLVIKDIDFCRFVDDIVIFCHTEEQARIVIYQLASTLDKQQKLILQRQKTKIYSSKNFYDRCQSMLEDQPIDALESNLLTILKAKSGGNPYITIQYHNLTDEEKAVFSQEAVENIIKTYISSNPPDFVRLRWFFRRLTQIGTPSAINYCITNIDKIIPSLSDVCHYIISAAENYDGNWNEIGSIALKFLDHELIKTNEYFQISILNLFVRNPSLNHLASLINNYHNYSSNLKHEIILTAFQSGAGDWIRELKEEYRNLDIYCKRAFLIATSCLPADERKFFFKNIQDDDILNKIIIKWANSQ